jgi:excisionase family DNA binding protein
MPKTTEILTAKQVAEYLHIHPLTVQRYARDGMIPAFKIGTDWRFHKKYIEKWIKQKHAINMNNKKQTKTLFEQA